MNVLVIGAGGREHALCHLLARSPRLGKLFILPGNAGTAALGVNIPGDANDVGLALSVARREGVGLTVVGPEEPLALGIADAFRAAGLRIFGPSAAAARIEADKGYAKQVMRQHAIPTAEYREFSDYGQARKYISSRDEPLVVKAAGLAKGKGVIMCADPAEAILAAERILRDRVFGAAGARIIVEERLVGREASLMAIVDGHTILVLEPAQDYKRLRDGDEGPNTGGMGSFSPTAFLDQATLRQVEEQILVPVVDALVREGVHYCGVLYVGLMLTPGGPKVLEFNCRFGDPETQALVMRLRSDVLDVLEAACDGRLDQMELTWDARSALCVVMASAGYPEKSSPPAVISGLPEGPSDDLAVFHAGTTLEGGRVMATGGRVLGVTALGETLHAARARAYAVVDGIRFEGARCRRDLGLEAHRT
ncbi:MAG: phosphoribosylamine--glycine ligase [Phycisphaerae bacterium]|nr:phosphoribosylamine--glycine ligase [Phycisphaerae bacterium]MCZ2401284.1 phosphoribosylamine--glycine ligase [Phycisphaerae bacterium]